MSEALHLKNQLCHRLYTASNALTRAYRPLLTPLDLTYPQYVVLMSLWENDNIPIQRLIHHTHIDGGSLTQILNKLSKKEYLTLHSDPSDRRKRRVCLTEKGRALEQEAEKVPRNLVCQIQGFSLTEAQQLAQLLDKLNQAIQEPGETE